MKREGGTRREQRKDKERTGRTKREQRGTGREQ
jgi:hypothetical protein